MIKQLTEKRKRDASPFRFAVLDCGMAVILLTNYA